MTDNLIFFIARFHSYNFLQYTGLKTELKADKFLQRAVEQRLSEKDFEAEDNFIADKKIEILESAMQFPFNPMVIEVRNPSKILLKSDMGDESESYVLTFRRNNENNTKKILYPVGADKEDIRNAVNPKYPVVAIAKKRYKEVLYDNITYKTKKIKTDNLFMPKELMAVLSDNAICELKQKLLAHK